MEPETNTSMSTPTTPSHGPVIGIVIVIALIVIGGFYFYNTQVMNLDLENDASMTDDATSSEPELSDSDNVADIEADLDAEFKDLNNELDSMDKELQ